jgi:hypothetical protein
MFTWGGRIIADAQDNGRRARPARMAVRGRAHLADAVPYDAAVLGVSAPSTGGQPSE